MAINTAKLKTELTSIFSKSNSAEEAANAIANALETWIKTAQVSTSVTGTCETAAGAGTIAGTGTGSIS